MSSALEARSRPIAAGRRARSSSPRSHHGQRGGRPRGGRGRRHQCHALHGQGAPFQTVSLSRRESRSSARARWPTRPSGRPTTDLLFDEEFPSGATDQALVAWALGFVPGISYVGRQYRRHGHHARHRGARGVRLARRRLGLAVRPAARPGHALPHLSGSGRDDLPRADDRPSLEHHHQLYAGDRGHPRGLDGLAEHRADSGTPPLSAATTTATVSVPMLGTAYGINDFQGDGATAATRHPEHFSSDLIEDGNDEDGTPLGLRRDRRPGHRRRHPERCQQRVRHRRHQVMARRRARAWA